MSFELEQLQGTNKKERAFIQDRLHPYMLEESAHTHKSLWANISQISVLKDINIEALICQLIICDLLLPPKRAMVSFGKTIYSLLLALILASPFTWMGMTMMILMTVVTSL